MHTAKLHLQMSQGHIEMAISSFDLQDVNKEVDGIVSQKQNPFRNNGGLYSMPSDDLPRIRFFTKPYEHITTIEFHDHDEQEIRTAFWGYKTGMMICLHMLYNVE
jgi:hypothetical protein